MLEKLPSSTKISIALDCWTSPFRQAFMAITGYFIDDEWNYREILLGFEPLHGSHSSANLSAILFDLLQQYDIIDRVLSITTDNASNNLTLIESMHDSIQSSQIGVTTTMIRVPCIAHVIQLSLQRLLGQMKANPKNETTEINWSEARSLSLRERHQKREISDTLNKVSYIIIMIFHNTNYYLLSS